MSLTAKFSDFATPRATKEVLEQFGIDLKHALGQNFLVNDAVIGKILELASVEVGERILEVGPGIGTLTSALLKRGARVVAIEKDAALPDVLAETLEPYASSFTLLSMDALDLSADDVPAPFPQKMVANLPYAVAATIILDYFERFSSLRLATVMVQKEVADRIAAVPGTKNYGAYTVKLSLYARPTGSFPVSRNDFMPPPHVDSTVIRLDRSGGIAAQVDDVVIKAAALMADAAFASRRKTIANSCKTFFASRGEEGARIIGELSALFEEVGVDPRIRGEVLPPEQYLEMGRVLARLF